MGKQLDTDATIKQFVDAVQRYCAWVEGPPEESHKELVAARQLLAELHLAAINLPEVDFDVDHESKPVPKEEWEYVRQRFSNLPVEGYWDVFNPLEEEEPVFNTLSDDLADIYSDIKEDLSLYEAGHIYQAVWHWRFNYLIHWGKHLMSAQRALHSYFAKTEEKEW